MNINIYLDQSKYVNSMFSNPASGIGFRGFRLVRWPKFETRGSQEKTPKKIHPC
jgi:hypothetical protein